MPTGHRRGRRHAPAGAARGHRGRRSKRARVLVRPAPQRRARRGGARLPRAPRSRAGRVAEPPPHGRPDAIHWRYEVALNGVSVVVPRRSGPPAARMPGVERLADGDVPLLAVPWPRAGRQRPPQLIGATDVWGPTLANAGQGMKIAIIDDGIDQTHPYFDADRLLVSARLPEGETDLHDSEGDRRARVPVAVVALEERGQAVRPGATPTTRPTSPASRPATTTRRPTPGKSHISGIAPKAYIGNYKASPSRPPASGSTATRPRSPRRSTRRLPTG